MCAVELTDGVDGHRDAIAHPKVITIHPLFSAFDLDSKHSGNDAVSQKDQ